MSILTASDRSSLIRLASGFPVGSEERLVIISGIVRLAKEKRKSNFRKYMDEVWDGGKKKVPNPNPKTRDKHPEVSVSTAIKNTKSNTYKEVMKGFKGWTEQNNKTKSNSNVSGRGSVSEKASVSENALVSGNAKVKGNAKISGDAKVFAKAQVFDDARVSGSAKVSGKSKIGNKAAVYDNARVYGEAIIGENAHIRGKTRVSGKAQVGENAVVSQRARIYGESKVYGNAKVYGSAKVSGDSNVYDNASVYGKAKMFGVRTHISGNAQLFGNATLRGDYCSIEGDAQVFGNAYVGGSGVRITGRAKIKDNAKIRSKEGLANITDDAEVSGSAICRGSYEISGDAKIYGNAVVGVPFAMDGYGRTFARPEISGKARIGGTAIILSGRWDGSEGEVTEGIWIAPGVPASDEDILLIAHRESRDSFPEYSSEDAKSQGYTKENLQKEYERVRADFEKHKKEEPKKSFIDSVLGFFGFGKGAKKAASGRSALIRLASAMPAGDETRRAILSRLAEDRAALGAA